MLAQTIYPERPYTCGLLLTPTQECNLLTISVGGREYSRVSGHIRAYQYGIPDAFLSDFGLTQQYLSGISITHGVSFNDPSDPSTHIWAGSTQLTTTETRQCSCGDPPDIV